MQGQSRLVPPGDLRVVAHATNAPPVQQLAQRVTPTSAEAVEEQAHGSQTVDMLVKHSDFSIRVFNAARLEAPAFRIMLTGEVQILYPDNWKILSIQRHGTGGERGDHTYTIFYERKELSNGWITAAPISLESFSELHTGQNVWVKPDDNRVTFVARSKAMVMGRFIRLRDLK
jgi:hypothetical protein